MSSPPPPEEPRNAPEPLPVSALRPTEITWRPNSLTASRHSRWNHDLRPPLASHDLERAHRICAVICRLALRDFAPGLALLPSRDRLRLQAVAAYGLTLFDFVRQPGLEGERLTAINRWEFDLETTLSAQTRPTQPVFLVLHDLEQQRPWPREAFDALHGQARRRAAVPRPVDADAAGRESVALAEPLAWLFLGTVPEPAVTQWLAALIRLRDLIDLGEDLRRHQPRIPVCDLPQAEIDRGEIGSGALATAIAREISRLRELSPDGPPTATVPAELRRAACYCHLAGRKLLSRADRLGNEVLVRPPRLRLADRLGLLARSWLP